MLLREFRFQSAPATAVAGDDDLAAHVDAAAGQLLVVVRHAVVGVDEFRGDVAVAAVDVVGRQGALETGGAVASYGRFGERGRVGMRPEQLQCLFLGCGVQHAEGFDMRIPAPLKKLRQHEVGVGLVVR